MASDKIATCYEEKAVGSEGKYRFGAVLISKIEENVSFSPCSLSLFFFFCHCCFQN